MKSIRSKTLISILPVVLIGMVLISFLSIYYFQNLLSSKLNDSMNSKLQENKQQIEKSLGEHSKISLGLAKVAETLPRSFTMQDYSGLLKNIIAANTATYGAGIYFEPYKYLNSIKYFGPYAYKDGDKTVYTEDYSTESYNYPSYDWYKNGMNTKESIVWSLPFYDEVSKISMVTATAPMYDSNKNFIGVAAADVNITTIQNIIGSIKNGDKGRAFLIGRDGTYIADKDKSKVMKTKISGDKNASLASLGKAMLSGNSGKGEFSDQYGAEEVFYTKIAGTNWTLALAIPKAELLKEVSSVIYKLIIIIIISVLTVVGFVIFFTNYLSKSLNNVNKIASAMAEGDMTQRFNVTSSDEIGKMGSNLNKMVENTSSIINTILENSHNMNSASESLLLSIEEMSSKFEDIKSSTEGIVNGIQETSASSEEINASVEEVNSSVQELSQKALGGSNVANDSKKKALEVQRNGQAAIDKAKDVYEEKQSKILKAIEDGKVVNEIKIMAETIASIAEQTNLLALNAAIEAARAGEQGKGFAVVANEVKKLAEESSIAVSNIKETIMKVQEAFKNMSSNCHHILSFIKEEVNPSFANFENMGNEYHKDADYVSVMSDEIASASEELTATIGQVSEAVQSMTEVAQSSSEKAENIKSNIEDTTKDVEKISSSAMEQAEIAKKLSDTVKKFKLS